MSEEHWIISFKDTGEHESERKVCSRRPTTPLVQEQSYANDPLQLTRQPAVPEVNTHTCQWRKQVYVIFLEILGTVESALCQLAAFVRYSGPVRLTHHKADSALSICVLLLFEVSPPNLDKDSQRCLFMTRENHLHIKGFTGNPVFLKCSQGSKFSSLCCSSALPFSSLAQTCVWRSRQAAGGSRQGLQRPHVSSSRCLQVRPTCLYKWEIRTQSKVNIAVVFLTQSCRNNKLRTARMRFHHKHVWRQIFTSFTCV